MEKSPLGYDDKGEDPYLLKVNVDGMLTASTSGDEARETVGNSPLLSAVDSLEDPTSTDTEHAAANTPLAQSENDLIITPTPDDHVVIPEISLRDPPVRVPHNFPHSRIGNQLSSSSAYHPRQVHPQPWRSAEQEPTFAIPPPDSHQESRNTIRSLSTLHDSQGPPDSSTLDNPSQNPHPPSSPNAQKRPKIWQEKKASRIAGLQTSYARPGRRGTYMCIPCRKDRRGSAAPCERDPNRPDVPCGPCAKKGKTAAECGIRTRGPNGPKEVFPDPSANGLDIAGRERVLNFVNPADLDFGLLPYSPPQFGFPHIDIDDWRPGHSMDLLALQRHQSQNQLVHNPHPPSTFFTSQPGSYGGSSATTASEVALEETQAILLAIRDPVRRAEIAAFLRSRQSSLSE